jgi:hypothetical protein
VSRRRREGRDGESGAEIVTLDAHLAPGVEAARRRVTGIVKLWAATPGLHGLDLFWLVVSCYLQGTADGYDCAVREQERKAGG